MPQVIEVPGFGDVEFPDDMNDEQIASAIQSNMIKPEKQAPAPYYHTDVPKLPGEAGFDNTPSPSVDRLKGLKKYFSGINTAAGNLNRAEGSGFLGAVDAVGSVARGAIAAPIGAVRGVIQGDTPEAEAKIADDFVRKYASPFSEQGRAQLGMLGAIAAPLSDSGADVALAPLTGTLGRQVPKAPGLKTTVPSTRELGEAAKRSYETARQAGVVLKPESFGKAVSTLKQTAKEEGYHPRLHPKASVALDELDAAVASGESMPLDKVEQLRRIAKSAEKSIEPDERRIASVIVDQLDEYIDNMSDADTSAGNGPQAAQALKDARALYTRNRKSTEIEGLIERAKERSAQFSGSGLENAIRTEFRQLAMNEKRMRRFTKEEQDAIRHVSRGGKGENALRMIGKLAPTGGLSAWLSILGTSLNPVIGAVPLTGLAARGGATLLTNRNANRAAELMRGGPIPQAQVQPGLLGSQASPESSGLLFQELERQREAR
jgi:hypothetical protein